MANRRFEQFSYSLVKKKTDIVGVASLSATGAVSAQDIPGASLAKTDTGEYTLTLEDKYNACLGFFVSIAENDEDLVAKPGAVDVASAKTAVIKIKDQDGADTDVTATAKVYVHLILKNSSI